MKRDIAIQAIRELIGTKILRYEYNQALLVALDELRKNEQRPIIKNGEVFMGEKSEIPTGAWVGIDEEPCEEWECNNCGNVITNVDAYELEYHKYCHKCGAKMSTPWADMRGKE